MGDVRSEDAAGASFASSASVAPRAAWEWRSRDENVGRGGSAGAGPAIERWAAVVLDCRPPAAEILNGSERFPRPRALRNAVFLSPDELIAV